MRDDDMPSDDDIMQVLTIITEPDTLHSADSYAPGTHPDTKWQQRQPIKLACWSSWLAAERKMMDVMLDENMFGKPVARSRLPADAVVLSIAWNYSVKMDGTFKARTCCDGCRLKTKGIQYVEHYATCISQCGMGLFFAICTINNFVVLGADAINACAQSPPPKTPSYVRLDAQYLAWYIWKSDIALDPNMVLPVLHDLQGHPDSGSLWAELIVACIPASSKGTKYTPVDRLMTCCLQENLRRCYENCAHSCLLKSRLK
jgi:hypothetical protein